MTDRTSSAKTRKTHKTRKTRKTRETRAPARARKTRAPAARRTAKHASKRTLLPVMRPAQNMREIVKQMILLEDHLFQQCKRCPDCIRKHFLTIEGLAEECGTLCGIENAAVAKDAGELAGAIRVLHHAWEAGIGRCEVARTVATRIRQLRKPLMAGYAKLPVEALPSRETDGVASVLRAARPAARKNAAT